MCCNRDKLSGAEDWLVDDDIETSFKFQFDEWSKEEWSEYSYIMFSMHS